MLLRAVVAAMLQRPSSNAATVVSSCVHTSSVPAWLRGCHGGLFISARRVTVRRWAAEDISPAGEIFAGSEAG